MIELSRLGQRHIRESAHTYSKPRASFPILRASLQREGDEVSYVFQNFRGPGGAASAEDLAISDLTRTYWIHFARKGDPNGRDADGSDMPLGKPFTQEDPHRMFFRDRVYSSNKGPDDVMKFRIRQYLKKHN